MKEKMKIGEINEKVLAVMKKSLPKKQPESVISVEKTKTGFKVLVEVLERKAIPNSQDLMGIYEIDVSADGEINSYKQIKTKKRIDTEKSDES